MHMDMHITSSLKIKAQLRLKILKLYIHSQIPHELKLYSFVETWIVQNLDSMCAMHIGGWLGMPISSCIKEFASLPKYRGGLGIPTKNFLVLFLVLFIIFDLFFPSCYECTHCFQLYRNHIIAQMRFDRKSTFSHSTNFIQFHRDCHMFSCFTWPLFIK